MKEMDDIENLFSSVFAEEKAVPPTAVKSSIDAELFGGTSSPNRLWILLPILLLFLSVGIYFQMNSSEINEKQLVTNSIVEVNTESNNVNKSSANSPKKNDVESINGLIEKDIKTKQNNDALISVKNNAVNSNFDKTDYIVGAAKIVNDDFNASALSLIGETASLVSSTGIESNESLETENNYTIMPGEVNSSINSLRASLLTQNIKQGAMSQNDSESLPINSNKVLPKGNGIDYNNSSGSIVDQLRFKELSAIENLLMPSIIPFTPMLNRNTSKFFEMGLYTGVNHISNQFSVNFSDGRKLKESIGYQTSLEFSWGISTKARIVTGFEFSQNRTLYTANVSMTISDLDSTYYDYITSVDTSGTEIIIDSMLVDVYSDQTVNAPEELQVSQVAFSIPIYLKYRINIKNRLNLNISTGVLFSYLSQRTSSVSSPIQLNYKKYGVSLMLRPELAYNWSHFGIGVYAKGMIDFSPGSTWNDAARNRLLIGGGVSLNYRF